MKRLVAAAVVATLLAGSPVFAQDQTAEAVMTGMSQLGYDVEGMVLTEEQVLQIQTILNGTEGDEDKVSEIDALLAN